MRESAKASALYRAAQRLRSTEGRGYCTERRPMSRRRGMKRGMRNVGFFLFPRVTSLDFVGVYDALRRLSGVTLRFLGTESSVVDEGGLELKAEKYPKLDELDLLVVPGGLGTRALEEDERCID